MHPNPAFRKETDARAMAFARDRGFGVLVVDGEASHIPFWLDDNRLEAHLTRANPILRALKAGPQPALLIVSGPDGYVSPDWYGGEADMVPTWNYVAAHLRGELKLADWDLHAHLDRLSDRFEASLAPKPVWKTAKMSPDAMKRMMRMILPVEMTVDSIASTFKLNQNRSAMARAGAAAELAKGTSAGLETAQLAALMRALPADD